MLVAKSNIILDVKPWGSDTDMKLMETEIRKIECDGLLWGAGKLRTPVTSSIVSDSRTEMIIFLLQRNLYL